MLSYQIPSDISMYRFKKPSDTEIVISEPKKGINYINDTTIIKIYELTNDLRSFKKMFRSGETTLLIDEVLRRTKFEDYIKELVKKLNKNEITSEDKIVVPVYLISTLLDRQKIYPKISKYGQISIPSGSHICECSIYTEIEIHRFLSILVTQEQIPHIAILHDWWQKDMNMYLKIERYDHSLYRLLEELSKEDVISIIFQTLFTLEYINRKFSISHNDMHLKNIMLEKSDYITWKNIHISILDNICYILDGSIFVLPKPKYFVRIIDFGCASKWSEPFILSKDIIERGIDGTIPNFPSQFYDPIFFLNCLSKSIKHHKLIEDMFKDILDVSTKDIFDDNNRPKMKYLIQYNEVSSKYFIMRCSIFRDLLSIEQKGLLISELN